MRRRTRSTLNGLSWQKFESKTLGCVRRRAFAVSLIASATLLAELVLTRVLSAGLYHHLAYFVVSNALLGTGVAAVWVHLRQIKTCAPPGRAPWAALVFAVGLPVCFAASQYLRPEPLLAALSWVEAARLGTVFVVLGVPFFGSGWVLAEIFDASDRNAPTLYAADLLGAAMGSMASLGSIPLFSGQDSLFVASALAAGAAMLFDHEGRLRTTSRITLGLSITALACSWSGIGILPLHISTLKRTPDGKTYASVFSQPSRHHGTEWTSSGRVDRVLFPDGSDRLIIDGGAAAVRIPDIRRTVSPSDATLPYELTKGARVLIIGSGAGWEIHEALAFDASHIEAIEINPAIARHTPKRLKTDPRVTLYVDEGRSFVARATGPYDAIIMIHTISNAATAAGALHLTEDFLFTQEALARLWSLLGDQGVLFVTRPEAQLPRLTATFRAIVGPGLSHSAFLWAERSARESFYAAILVAKMEPPAAIRQRIVDRIRNTPGLRLIAAPGQPPLDPLFAGLLSQAPLRTLEAIAGVRLDPAHDDQPFFNQRRRFSELSLGTLTQVGRSSAHARLALEEQPIAEASALLLLLQTMAVAALVLFAPLLFRHRRSRTPPGTGFALLFFSLLGVGFMFVELALVQRLTLLLGRPALSFAIVFTGLLAGAGLGSRMAPAMPSGRSSIALASMMAITLALGLAPLTRAFITTSLPMRLVVTLAIVLGTGFCLGAPFPSGLERVSDRPGLGALGLAVNAFCSVAATALAVLLATEIGFSGVFGLAAVSYALAAWAFPRLVADVP